MSIDSGRPNFFGTIFSFTLRLDCAASELTRSWHFKAIVEADLPTAHNLCNFGVNDFILSVYYFVFAQHPSVLPAREVVLQVVVKNWVVSCHCWDVLYLKLWLYTTASFMHFSY